MAKKKHGWGKGYRRREDDRQREDVKQALGLLRKENRTMHDNNNVKPFPASSRRAGQQFKEEQAAVERQGRLDLALMQIEAARDYYKRRYEETQQEVKVLTADVSRMQLYWPEAAEELEYKATRRGFLVGASVTAFILITFFMWVL